LHLACALYWKLDRHTDLRANGEWVLRIHREALDADATTILAPIGHIFRLLAASYEHGSLLAEAVSILEHSVWLLHNGLKTNAVTVEPLLAHMLYQLGDAYIQSGAPAKAKDVLAEAVGLSRQLAEADPGSYDELQAAIARLYAGVAVTHSVSNAMGRPH
jgi:hypothetical protein